MSGSGASACKARPIFEVLHAGLQTTVQDLGRTGYQNSGIVVSGAMDLVAARVGNMLVGNRESAAVLEATLLGPWLRALGDVEVAITGGDLSLRIDDEQAPMWTPVSVRSGQVVRFGTRVCGARAYVAAAGGFACRPVMGSRSTYIRGKMGGYEGRALAAGDILAVDDEERDVSPLRGWSAPPDVRRQYEPDWIRQPLRIVDGPHVADFSNEGLRELVQSEFIVGADSDRMAYRLEGCNIERSSPVREILSEAVVMGALQASPDNLMLLMADRQTTGGYPVVGVVCSCDLSRAAQLCPGDAVQFEPIELAEAHEELAMREGVLETMRWAIRLRTR